MPVIYNLPGVGEAEYFLDTHLITFHLVFDVFYKNFSFNNSAGKNSIRKTKSILKHNALKSPFVKKK